jgi:hypothetical protein
MAHYRQLRGLFYPAHRLPIRTGTLVPQVCKVLKEIIIGDDETRHNNAWGWAALAILAGDERAPPVRRAFHQKTLAEHLDRAHGRLR